MMISKDEIIKNKLLEYRGTYDKDKILAFIDSFEEVIHDYLDFKLFRFLFVDIIANFREFKSFKDLSDDVFVDFVFVISLIKGQYYLFYNCLRSIKGGIDIRNDIDSLNQMNPSELKQTYKDMIKSEILHPKRHLLSLIEYRRKCGGRLFVEQVDLNEKDCVLEIRTYFDANRGVRRDLLGQFKDDLSVVKQVMDWHERYHDVLLPKLNVVLGELSFHSNLKKTVKLDLLMNEEYLKTSEIRFASLDVLPNWLGESKCVDYSKLDELWLRPASGYLHRLLNETETGDKQRLARLQSSEAFAYRGLGLTTDERKENRLLKLKASVEGLNVAIFLGRQNRSYHELMRKLNLKYKGEIEFISDHSWSRCGYIEPGVKSSNSWLSILQAIETIRRLPELGFKPELIANRQIAFCLDGYDAKHAMAAMYSNPNRIERNYPKPNIEGLDQFEFAYTGLTDLELANIVRNREWFSLLRFYRTGVDGEPERLDNLQVEEEYGIKYIGIR